MYSSHMSINSHAPMEIDTWMSERPQSHITNSYSTGGQPPSLGDLRQTVLSEPSGGNQMYSDGQPPSLSDVGRRAPSQSEPSPNAYDYEGYSTHEDQETRISEIGAEKNDINLELSLACPGPLLSRFNLPATRPHVVSNLQGHSDQEHSEKAWLGLGLAGHLGDSFFEKKEEQARKRAQSRDWRNNLEIFKYRPMESTSERSSTASRQSSRLSSSNRKR